MIHKLRTQRVGKPVVTTNQVSMWAILNALGRRDMLAGHGRLLEKGK